VPMKSATNPYGTNEGRTPPHFHLDTSSEFVQQSNCHELYENNPRKLDVSRALIAVAVLCQGDFIRRVGRAYRMSATNRPARHASVYAAGTRIPPAFRDFRWSDTPAGFAFVLRRVPEHGSPRCQVLDGRGKNTWAQGKQSVIFAYAKARKATAPEKHGNTV
jgi:hypothetical protein